jgi:hypothetical protein
MGKPKQDESTTTDATEVEVIPAAKPEATGTAVAAPRAAGPTSVAGYNTTNLGTGFEDFTQDDLAVPFIAILQSLSPQVLDDNPKRIAGAKAGMLFNNVTNELYDGKEGIVVVPIHRVRQFIEWIPKDDGGGLVGVYAPEEPQVQEVLKAAGKKVYGKLPIGDGNDLVETFSIFSLLLLPGGFTRRVVISMASSQIGQYKKWMTMAREIQVIKDEARGPETPPLWSHKYRLTTFYHQKKNQSWYKWFANFDGGNAEAARLADTDPICEQAKQFRHMVLTGQATANYQNLEQDRETEGDDFQM